MLGDKKSDKSSIFNFSEKVQWARIITLVAAFLLGVYFENYVEKRDHPIEQAIEQVLKANGIIYDFSKDKGEKKNP